MLKAKRFCKHAGCNNLTRETYCEEHKDEAPTSRSGKHKLSAQERGYTFRWSKYSKWFLSQPENQFCKLHLDDGCAIVAECVDHIVPPKSARDPNFWNPDNFQSSCRYCNSKKGHRTIVGTYEYGKE